MQPSLPVTSAVTAPSLVELIVRGTLDADLAALVWVLVEGHVPVVVIAPEDRLGAGRELLEGILASIRPELASPDLDRPLGATAVRRLVRGQLAGGVTAGSSLQEVHLRFQAPPLPLSDEELTFLGCVLVLGPATDPGRPAASRGRLRVVAAHYVRPLARDAHGHSQLLGPAVLTTWDGALGRYEHFSWGVLPEIAARLGRRPGDLERDLHHRRDDLAGLATAGVTGLDEVHRLIAGYQAGYQAHDRATH